MKSRQQINLEMRELRQLIETTDNPTLGRIAYAMECAVFAVMRKNGRSLVEEAQIEAHIMKNELEAATVTEGREETR